MKRLGSVAREFLERREEVKRNNARAWKKYVDRAAIAKSDEMSGLPTGVLSIVVPQIERVVFLCESPIEQVALYQLAGRGYGLDFKAPMYATVSTTIPDVFEDADFVVVPQFKVGPYRADFLLAFPSRRKIVVECDGKKFHDAERDGRRDDELRNIHGISDIIRVRGAEIWSGPSWTDRVAEAIRRVEWY